MHLESVEGYGVALHRYWNVAGCSLVSQTSFIHRVAAGWQEKNEDLSQIFLGSALELLPWNITQLYITVMKLLRKATWREKYSFFASLVFLVSLGSFASGPVVRQSISTDGYGRTKCLACGRQQGKGKEPGASYHPTSTCSTGLCGPTPNICHCSTLQPAGVMTSKHELLGNILNTYANNQFCSILVIK